MAAEDQSSSLTHQNGMSCRGRNGKKTCVPACRQLWVMEDVPSYKCDGWTEVDGTERPSCAEYSTAMAGATEAAKDYTLGSQDSIKPQGYLVIRDY